MQRTKIRHNLARLRLEFLNSKPTQKEFGDRLGVSVDMIKSIENCREPLRTELAVRIGQLTTVSQKWLLENDLLAPPTDYCGSRFDRDSASYVFEDRSENHLRAIKVLLLESLGVIAETVLRAADKDLLRQYTLDLQVSLQHLWARITDHAPLLIEVTDGNRLATRLREQSDPLSEFLWAKLPETTQQLLRPAWALRSGDITNLPAFIMALKKTGDEVAVFLRGRLCPTMQERIADLKDSKLAVKKLRDALASELNHVIAGPLIYEKTRFAGKSLPEEVLKLLEKPPKEEELCRLNRKLLAVTYPQFISSEGRETKQAAQSRRRTLEEDLTQIVRTVKWSDLCQAAQESGVKFASDTKLFLAQQTKGEAEVRLNCHILRDASDGLIRIAINRRYDPRCQEIEQSAVKLYGEADKPRPNYQPLLDTFFACLGKELHRKEEERKKPESKAAS